MQNIRQAIGAYSPLTISATLSVVALFCVAGYKVEQMIVSHTDDNGVIASATTSSGQNDTVTDVNDLNGFGPSHYDPTATTTNDILTTDN